MEKSKYRMELYLLLLICENITNKSKINKLIYFIDMCYASLNYKKNNFTGDSYRKLPYGPFPENIDHIRKYAVSNNLISFEIIEHESYYEYIYKTSENININEIKKILFKDSKAKKVINTVLKILYPKSSIDLSELSHNIEPWKSSNIGDIIHINDFNMYRFIKNKDVYNAN